MLRMARRVSEMLAASLPAAVDGTIDDLAEIEAMDDEVDALHGLLLEYLGRVSQEQISGASSDELLDLFEATNSLEAIGDIIESNIVALGYQRIDAAIEVSAETRAVLSEYYEAVTEALELALVALTQKDESAARRVSGMKSHIKALERAATRHEGERLVADEPNRIPTYRFEMDLITHLKRIYFFARRIARVAVPESEQSQI